MENKRSLLTQTLMSQAEASEKKLDMSFKTKSVVKENLILNNYAPVIEPETSIKTDLLFKAPDSWNCFSKPQGDAYIELTDSIYNIGLQQAIVAWEMTVIDYKKLIQQYDKKSLIPELGNKKDNDIIYMILAGHTRVNIYKDLENIKVDSNNTQMNINYAKIPTRIYKNNSTMTENIAQQIIIDTNFLSRKLNSIEMSNSILKKYSLLGTTVTNKRELIANQLNIAPKQVTRYTNLNKLSEEFKNYIKNGTISIDNAQVLCNKDMEIQDFIYDNLSAKDIKKYKKIITQSDTIDILEKSLNEIKEREDNYTVVNSKIEVPTDKLEAFNEKLEALKKEFNLI